MEMKAEQALQAIEELDAVVAFVQGYRAKLLDAGFGPEAADRMAVDMHAGIMTTMFRAAQAR